MNYYIIRATINFKSKDDDVNIVFINRNIWILEELASIPELRIFRGR